MKVYIAGPMRNLSGKNFPAFDAARDYLKRHGWTVISPADLDRLHEGWEGPFPPDREFTEEDLRRFIKRDLNAVEEVDAIFLLKGWEKSKGARVEKAYAEFLNLQIMYE